ncbi:MAG TPA: hypothetical protein VE933_14830 [Chitinophagaceae bacterium]|jgi:hypothetical protein|nr:hypothetical protein [Chitinophagaceae bacterium]
MEVHHHSRHGKKKWTEYIWEFLMLFLAVFCGFLAENIREHKVEKAREKQFMKSLIEDLKADTASIANLNKLRNARHKMYDSLSSVIIEKKYAVNGAAVYYWGRSISRRSFFFSADGTLQQLKNSGGLRLISNKIITDKIIAYDVLYRSILRQQELEETQMNDYRALAAKIFDAAVFKKITNLQDTIVIEIPDGNPQLKDDSPALLNELTNQLIYWATGSTLLRQMLEQLEKKAAVLIELIQKEYNLK